MYPYKTTTQQTVKMSKESKYPLTELGSNVLREKQPIEAQANTGKSAFSDMGSIQLTISTISSRPSSKSKNNQIKGVRSVTFDDDVNEISFQSFHSQQSKRNEMINSNAAIICDLLGIKFDTEGMLVDEFIFKEVIERITNMAKESEGIKSKDSEIELLKEKIIKITRKLENSTEFLNRNKAEFYEYRKKNSDVIKSVDSLSADLVNQVEIVNQELKLEREKNNKLQTQVFEYRTEITKLNERNGILKSENKKLLADCVFKEKEISTLKETAQNQINYIHEQDQMRAKLDEDCGKLLDSQNEEISKLVKEIEDKEKSLIAKDDEINKLRQEFDSMKTKVANKTEMVQQKLEKKIRTKTEEIKQLKITHQNERQEFQDVILKLTENYTTLTRDQPNTTVDQSQSLRLSNLILASACRKFFKTNLDFIGKFLQEESVSYYQSLLEKFDSITTFDVDDLVLLNRMCKIHFHMLEHLSTEYWLYTKELGELSLREQKGQC
ncbi:uncharacterized protein SPAPADRAFT_64614 [Spathaspora passalidarum NRRL Y-27907]|uniref:Uncharacterized protein n=1 Tax=Spathaspora passalidarum (strain NRRL Y-27907 / 11-Y1) TaxID=619300 RepID=G3AH71_SPAPN|nr:uncharacterized protein SPAPADRAFT_64614 [Spathaspora passalidarum NRRL Y-27907]EGW35500.1 hypothetical protein SPAPADRAFT_64614 [Spathaspora passalidarum NRRL Y-27907]